MSAADITMPAGVSSALDNANFYADRAANNGFLGYMERVFDNSAYQNRFNAQQSAIERQFNAEQAQLQRDFEERMSSTAYQRAAADMRAAGLNPYAVYGGASAAAVPSGSNAISNSARGSGSSHNLLNTAIDLVRAVAGVVAAVG